MTSLRRVEVTDGTRPLGSIAVRDDEIEALTPLDGSLGLYPTTEEAARALWRFDRSGSTSLGEAAACAACRAAETHEQAASGGGV